MSEAAFLFVLRLASGAALLAFVGAVLYMLWMDFRAVAGEMEAQRVPHGRLVVLVAEDGGPPQDTEFPLMPLTSLGRAMTNTVRIQDNFASNEHALIMYRNGHWWLEDRGSSNGTVLNGTQIKEPVILDSGDLIGVGRVTLRLELDKA